MRTHGNTILITGGATGIGLALAEAFVKAGNKVLICGRREAKLREAKARLPEIQARQCDLSKKEERESFCAWVAQSYPDLNIVVNNAGIQRGIDIKEGTAEIFSGEDEVEVNFVAPIHLSAYFAPLLMKKKEAAIINVSSGLGFVP
ncbi:MAG: SDR family NAD(P)-dependent oxidoreductase, partial [Candidatus Hadarchaeum sp.]